MSKTKKIILLVFLGFFLSVGGVLYKKYFSSEYSYMKKVQITDQININIEKSFSEGCHAIGLYAQDGTFFAPLHMPYQFEGEYELEFYHKDKLLSSQTIDSKNALSHGQIRGGLNNGATNVVLHVVQTPLKGYNNLEIKLKSKKLDATFVNKEVYLYIEKHKGLCGKKRETWLNKRNNPIEKKETNTSLKSLFKALVTKDTNQVKTLTENNISVDIQMVGKRKPIHYSAFYDDVQTLEYLISKNATLNEKDITGKTPLHYAVEHNSTKALEVLLDNGAKLDLLDIVEDTYYPPVGVPVGRIRRPVKEILIVFIVERNLVELMEILLRKKYVDVSDLYRYYFSNSGEKKKSERTHLDWLLSEQEDYNNPNSKYKTFDYSNMIKLLRDYGAKTYKELQEENNNIKGKNNGK